MEVLQAIRDRVGPDFIVGLRFTADETMPGEIDVEERLGIAKRLNDSKLVDFLNVIRGTVHSDASMTNVFIPIQGTPSAPHIDFAGEVRKLSACQPSMRRGFRMWRRPGMRLQTACSIWSV
jgi:2,4-dienoyl-CoA reductase-like NADH-dependent reductase (Old Yellow Enzyme family)